MAAFEYSDFQQTAGPVVGTLLTKGKAVDASGLDRSLTERVTLRVSQINAWNRIGGGLGFAPPPAVG